MKNLHFFSDSEIIDNCLWLYLTFLVLSSDSSPRRREINFLGAPPWYVSSESNINKMLFIYSIHGHSSLSFQELCFPEMCTDLILWCLSCEVSSILAYNVNSIKHALKTKLRQFDTIILLLFLSTYFDVCNHFCNLTQHLLVINV